MSKDTNTEQFKLNAAEIDNLSGFTQRSHCVIETQDRILSKVQPVMEAMKDEVYKWKSEYNNLKNEFESANRQLEEKDREIQRLKATERSDLTITSLLSKYQDQKPIRYVDFIERQYPVSAVIDIIRELKGLSPVSEGEKDNG